MADDDVVEHKVRMATARNALHKISAIVAEEQQIDASKARYKSWMLRYGIAALIVMAGIVLARISGVI